MSCTAGVYNAQVECCRDIKIIAGLPMGTSYDITLRRPGKPTIHRRSYTTLTDGSLVILKTRYAKGILGCGFLEVVVREVNAAVTLTIGGKEYKSLMLELMKADGEYTNIIQ